MGPMTGRGSGTGAGAALHFVLETSVTLCSRKRLRCVTLCSRKRLLHFVLETSGNLICRVENVSGFVRLPCEGASVHLRRVERRPWRGQKRLSRPNKDQDIEKRRSLRRLW